MRHLLSIFKYQTTQILVTLVTESGYKTIFGRLSQAFTPKFKHRRRGTFTQKHPSDDKQLFAPSSNDPVTKFRHRRTFVPINNKVPPHQHGNRPPSYLSMSPDYQGKQGAAQIWQLQNHRVDPSVDDICPNCNGTPHDVAHLFECLLNSRQH